jgi:hypothetical protein
MPRPFAIQIFAGLGLAVVAGADARAQQTPAEIAQNLENPIYDQVSIPLQNNYDCCLSPGGGYKYTLNIEPVIPMGRIGAVEVISRTIFPIVYQSTAGAALDGHAGAGDTTQGFYFGMEHGRGLYYGGGPIFVIPSNDAINSSSQWAVGPTFAMGARSGPISASFIFWHYWSFAGKDGAAAVSKTRLQPSFSYTFPESTTLKVGVDADYDWVKRSWSLPFHGGVSHVFKVREHTFQLALEGKAFAATPKGPQAGARLTATWVFPR